MNDMVFMLVIQLARLGLLIVCLWYEMSHCDLQTKYSLFVSYCTSYYGSWLWDLQHRV